MSTIHSGRSRGGARGVRPTYFFFFGDRPLVSCTAPLIPSHWFTFKGMLARQTIRFSIFLVLGDMLINDGILALRQHCNVGTSVYGWMLRGHTYKTVNAELPHLCVFVCRKDDRCQSFNFVMPHQRCEFNNRTSKAKPGDFISSPDRLYFTRGISRGKFSVFLLTWSTQNKNGFSNLPFSTCEIFSVYVMSHGLLYLW